MRHDDHVARRIAARGDGVVHVGRIIQVGIGTHGDDHLGIEPRRAHRQHQRVVHHAFARIVELQDARERRAPGRETHILYGEPHLAEAVIEHRLVAQARQRLVIGIGTGLVVAHDRPVGAHGHRGER